MNPKTRAYLQQPDFMKMFAEIQKDSNALQKHMNDPRVMDLLSVALGVNVMGGEDFQNQNQAPPKKAAATTNSSSGTRKTEDENTRRD